MGLNLAPKLSFEFFPPRTAEAEAKLRSASAALTCLEPSYYSVTFGAGGSTRERTFETVLDLRTTHGVKAVPHISCIGFQIADVVDILASYKEADISHVVALRGDLPSGAASYGELRYANELVALIRKHFGSHFHIEVAAYPEIHPQCHSAKQDLENFRRKVAAGADGAITQYFYNTDAYFRFVDACARLGIDIPIVPGIMPITNYTQLVRFSDACGAEIPRWILYRLRDFGDDRIAIREFGIDVTTSLCEQLLRGGAPGLHFYTMNQSEASIAVCRHLNGNA